MTETMQYARLTGNLLDCENKHIMHHSASAVESGPWNDCLAIARQLLAQNMNFRMTVRVGSLSFSLDATKARNILLSTDSPEVRKTRKSPSTRARNRLRLERFLAKKKASTIPASSSPEPDCGGCPLELPGSAPNQTAPDGKGQTSSEINLPTTSQAIGGQRLVLNGSGSKVISEIQKAAEANALKVATLRNDMEKHKKLNGSLEEVAASTAALHEETERNVARILKRMKNLKFLWMMALIGESTATQCFYDICHLAKQGRALLPNS